MPQPPHVILIGPPGAGKSTVADALGQALGRPVIRIDRQVLTGYGRSGETLVRRFGAMGASRSGAIPIQRALARGVPTIIDSGGGHSMVRETRQRLRRGPVRIWLDRDPDACATLLQRHRKHREQRPWTVGGQHPRRYCAKVAGTRTRHYAALATHRIRPEPHETAGEIANRIIRTLGYDSQRQPEGSEP